MPPLTYSRLVAELFPRLTGGIRWGLERTNRLLHYAGDPQQRYPTIHVGGTNGKGSVAAVMASVLRAGGRRVGLYTSPHLCSFRERIQIDGRAISETALLAAAERLWPVIQEELPSFFEATTAIAFRALADAGVEIAVVEVGLGGRLDATNVITPLVSVLTNVSLDHVQYLGNTVEAVAREKAGIIKPGVPIVTGEHVGAAHDVFRWRAAELRAPFYALAPADYHADQLTLAGTRLTVPLLGGACALDAPLLGGHQASNIAVAVRALDLLPPPWRPEPSAVAAGVSAVRWPGRLQLEYVAGVPWMLDVAHNLAGVDALVNALAAVSLPRPMIASVGVRGDKDWPGMMVPLYATADEVLLTEPPTAPADRRWDPEQVVRTVASPRARVEPDFNRALEYGQRVALRRGGY
ncbi:MAG: bifunctional folylpolyglutamate synthase/dihydrofolate synthase, partial [Gemmatimonadetes bacterium]|nr:bifunctional folylpolyglutamate synthase/dihydrofolate synthase [Gemmatimonadota bacterium]